MSDSLNVLKDIGAQKIHNETHISKEHIQAIIHETFDGLNSVQFIGFISILEREYDIDLSELRAKGEAYFDEIKSKSTSSPKVFVVPKRQKNYSTTYILFGILVFVSFIYYTFVYLESVTPEIETVDNTKIENAKKSMRPVLEIKNAAAISDTNETNSSIAKEVNVPEKVEEVKVVRTLKVLPKNKVWVGYIDIKTNQRYQKVFTKEFSIDTSKDWLLLFGAGNIRLEVNGEIKKYASNKNMRFKYVDGVFTKITVTEFKGLNKGRKW